MKKLALSLVSFVALSGVGFAGGDIVPAAPIAMEEGGQPFYAGIALAAMSTRGSSADLSFFSEEPGQDRLGNITLNAGYDFHQYIGVEARYTTTISDEDVVEMSGWSIFVKPQYPVSDDFTIYALLGFGNVAIESINAFDLVDIDDSGFQWGLGLSYSLKSMTDSDVAIYVDYTSLATDMDGVYWNGDPQVNADALTVGITYRF